MLEVEASRVAKEKTGRVEVAGTRRIDQFRDRHRLDPYRLVALDDDRALFGTGDGRDLAILAN